MKKNKITTFRRILAIIGIALIVLMYLATLVFAFIDPTQSKSWLAASVFTTFFVAFVLYAFNLLLKMIQDKNGKEEQDIK
jgi:Na+/melibiose symporter-like transporter